jgi:GNAT superfamily N-acetyltransferase
MGTTVLQLTRTLYARPEVRLPDGMRLRTYASEADIERWLEVRHRAFARQRLGVRGWTRNDFHREFTTKPWWRPEHLWLMETAGAAEPQTIGAVALAFRGAAIAPLQPVVHWLAVLPQWRRRGIGRALMAALEQRAWDLGHRQVWLETHDAWQSAAELYRHLGYLPVMPT